MTALHGTTTFMPSPHQRTNGSFADHEPSLWRAVITQALMDAASQSRKSEARRTREDALRWLFSDSSDFEAVCDNAGFDPSYIRRRVKEALARNFEWRLPNGQGWRTQSRLGVAPQTPTQH
jgi:hypothetical protein